MRGKRAASLASEGEDQVVVRLAEESLLPHFHDPATHLTVTREPRTVERSQVGAACWCRPDVIVEALVQPAEPDPAEPAEQPEQTEEN